MTDTMGLILGVSGMLQAVGLMIAMIGLLCEWSYGRLHRIDFVETSLKLEAIFIGVVGLVLAIAYGIQLHLAAWN